MRHWLVRPELMCSKHLLGEHLECHMFLGSMRGNKSLDGFYEGGLFFGPAFLEHRHRQLKAFIEGHHTEITPIRIAEATAPWSGKPVMYGRKTYHDLPITKAVIKESRTTLLSRCGYCRSLHLRAKREGEKFRYTVPSRFASSDSPTDSGILSGGDSNT